MQNDMYHDAAGNRVMLDTRILGQVGNDPGYLERAKKKEARERQARRSFNFLKTVLCIPASAFVFKFVPVLYLHPVEMLEGAGVIACLAYMASTIRGFWEEE